MTRVIKLGGSLLQAAALPVCLAAVARQDGSNVLVPGGGVFAEQVRTQQVLHCFDDVAAHRMAILAMQQMALLMHSLQPAFCLQASFTNFTPMLGVTIWSPLPDELDNAGIAASWDVTSDSLAAWLAGWLGADELILVKSAEVDSDATLSDLQAQGIIDTGFIGFAERLSCPIYIVNKDSFIAAA